MRGFNFTTCLMIALLLLVSVVVPTTCFTSRSPLAESESLRYGCTKSKDYLLSSTSRFDRIKSSFAYQQTSSSFSFNTTLVLATIAQPNTYNQTLQQQLYSKIGQFSLYFGVTIVPFLLIVLLSPFLCACCLCPDTCSCCLTKDTTPPRIGACVLALTSLGLVVGISVLFLLSPNMADLYQDSVCSASLIMNDFMEGASVTADGKKYNYIGLNNISNTLITLNGTQSELAKMIDPITTNGTHINISDQLHVLPNQTGGDWHIFYNSPINEGNATNSILSQFPSILGSSGTQGSIVGAAMAGLITVQSAINQIVDIADEVQSKIPQIQPVIDRQIMQVDRLRQSYQSQDKQFDKQFTNVKYYLNISNISLNSFLIFTLFLFLCVLMSSLCLAYSVKRAPIRYLMYCNCCSLVMLSTLVLIIGIGFSSSTIGSYASCQAMSKITMDRQYFVNTFAPLFKIQTDIAECFGDGTGKINSTDFIVSGDFAEWIDKINQIDSQINQFDSQKLIEQLKNQYTQIGPTIWDYLTAKALDIDSQQDVQILQKLSDFKNYPDCQSQGFSQDSWVPSIHQQPVYVQCKTAGESSDASTCPNPANFTNYDPGCTGCMDSFDILSKLGGSDPESIQTMVESRYPNCSMFTSDIVNVWNNFYSIKESSIQPVYQRSQVLETSFQNLTTTIKSIQPILTQVVAELKQGFDSVINPDYGLVAGLNCRPLGDDIRLSAQIACGSALNYSFVMRIIFIALAWGIVLTIIFSVYVGANSYKLARTNQYRRVHTGLQEALVGENHPYFYNQSELV